MHSRFVQFEDVFDLALRINKIEFRDDGDIVIPERIEDKPGKVHHFINNFVVYKVMYLARLKTHFIK